MSEHRKLQNTELNRISTDAYKESKKLPLAIVLDNVRSMHNVGAVFRTSDAFRIDKIWLCGITGTPPDREIHKTALGAEESVTWEHRKDGIALVQELKEAGYKLYAAEQTANSTMLQDFTIDVSEKTAIIFGNEVKGVQQEIIDLCDGCVEIPQFGTKHSFNISVSTGIVLWQIVKPLLPQLEE